MKVFLWVGHPRAESLSALMADAYEEGLRAEHDVRRLDLADMQFDPNLAEGYSAVQPLEPSLVAWQEHLKWCDHTVWFYPDWWGGMPAKMKGTLDRALLPGFGFRYHRRTPLWSKLLKGRTADIVITAGAPQILDDLINGAPIQKQVRNSVLDFVGIRTRAIIHLTAGRKPIPPRRLRKWQRRVAACAKSLG